MDRVRLYVDFVSPYAWLALTRVERLQREAPAAFELRPVVYAALLDHAGLVGPAESAVKRVYTFHDVARCAREAGRRFEGPPAHPFRSIEALRTACLFADGPQALPLAVALADAAWAEGSDLTDLAELERIVADRGLDASDLARRIAAPEIKARLRSFTEEAIACGVFGVPTFVYRGELFWGHDRIDALARRVGGEPPPQTDPVRSMLERPRGADRHRIER